MEINELIEYTEKELNKIETKDIKEVGLIFLCYLIDIDKNRYNGELNLDSIIGKMLSELNKTIQFNEGLFYFSNDFSTQIDSYDKISYSIPYNSAETSDFSKYDISKNEFNEDIYQIAFQTIQIFISNEINIKQFVKSFIEKIKTEINNSDDFIFYI